MMLNRSPSERNGKIVGLRSCMVVYSHYPNDPRVSREAQTLSRAGAEVDVFCLGEAGRPSTEDVEGVHVIRIPLEMRRGGSLRYAWQYGLFLFLTSAIVFSAWRVRRYDVIHVHSLPDFLVFCAIVPRAFGTHIILDLHEAMPEILASRFRLEQGAVLVVLARVLERMSAAFAHTVFVVNDAIRDVLVCRGVESRKLVVLPNMADDQPVTPASRQLLVDRYGFHASHTIVVAGGLNPERDIETLIRSISRPPVAGLLDLLLLGRGDPDYVERIRTLVNKLGVGNRVALGGFVSHPEALSLLALSDVGVVTLVDNPITRLAVPNRLYEFASLDKPLVVPRLPAIESLVGEHAYYYTPGDADGLATAIARALNGRNSSKREDRQKSYRTWRWAEVSNRLLEAYQLGQIRAGRATGEGSLCM